MPSAWPGKGHAERQALAVRTKIGTKRHSDHQSKISSPVFNCPFGIPCERLVVFYYIAFFFSLISLPFHMSRASNKRNNLYAKSHFIFFFLLLEMFCFVFSSPRVCACNLMSLVVVRVNNPRRRNMKETVMFYKFFFFFFLAFGRDFYYNFHPMSPSHQLVGRSIIIPPSGKLGSL